MEKNSKTLSFEFFPPKTASGLDKLVNIAKNFEAVPAEYFSVTFGAGGSTQQGTLDTCSLLFDATKTPIAPHISGIGSAVPTPAGAVCLNDAAQGTFIIFLSSVTKHHDCIASIKLMYPGNFYYARYDQTVWEASITSKFHTKQFHHQNA